ncbi:MAG TPA: glycosyltransferase family 2 protein [bacterium]|nr:glycosyltransferase family 2 protein [bacterium]HPT29662.1 glycosyltransferase family 2 protein [bacterium]
MANSSPKISVIIPNLNGADFLKNCLPSLKAQSEPDFELILVDNNSIDDSRGITRNYFPTAQIIKNEKNEGFSRAVNMGIAAANSEYIFLLNNDTALDRHCLERIIQFLEQNNQVHFGATKMLYYHDHRIINNTGDTFSIYGAANRRGNGEIDRGQYEKIEKITGACAGAAFYRRSLLEELGGFDEDFFAYLEDVDLSLRAQALGYECWYLPEAIVYHVDGGTSQKFKNFSFFLVTRNSLYTVLKNFPTGLLITSLPFLLLSQGRNIINGFRFHCLKSVIRVYLDLGKNFRKLYRKRRQIQKNRKVSCRYMRKIISKKMSFDLKKLFYVFLPRHR